MAAEFHHLRGTVCAQDQATRVRRFVAEADSSSARDRPGVRLLDASSLRLRLRRVRQRPHRTAMDFRNALETEFSGAFSDIVFTITDWSPGRRFLGPFRDVFA